MGEAMTLMTIEEVAALLHYSVKTVYKKAARGEIPSIALSRRKRLFDASKLSCTGLYSARWEIYNLAPP